MAVEHLWSGVEHLLLCNWKLAPVWCFSSPGFWASDSLRVLFLLWGFSISLNSGLHCTMQRTFSWGSTQLGLAAAQPPYLEFHMWVCVCSFSKWARGSLLEAATCRTPEHVSWMFSFSGGGGGVVILKVSQKQGECSSQTCGDLPLNKLRLSDQCLVLSSA